MPPLPFQPVPNTAQFRIIGGVTLTGADVINSFYVRNDFVAWDNASLLAMATVIGNKWRDQVLPQLSSGYLLDRVEGRDLEVQLGAFAIAEYNDNGAKLGAAVTPAVCQLIKLQGASGGQPRQGRLFISPFDETQVTQDNIEAATSAALVTAILAIETAIETGTNVMVLVSRFLGGLRRASGVTNPVAGVNARALIAMQRDRRTGIGS